MKESNSPLLHASFDMKEKHIECMEMALSLIYALMQIVSGHCLIMGFPDSIASSTT